MDVQQKLELAIPMLVQETVNGVHTPNGVNAASLVMEGPKTEPESCSKVLSMGEWTVLDKPPNSETVTCMDAQLTANGVLGRNGICVQEVAEEVCKEEHGQSWSRKGMEENDATEIQLK